jgi:putative YhbY family RNA-binding protein
LRSQAHGLKPVVLIGEAGLSETVVKEIDALNAHSLIKVRVFGDDREARIEIYDTICADLNAAPIQHIGKLLVIYRPQKDDARQVIQERKGLREVTIVKPSASGTKKPTVKKVLVKGNERVTQGGNIKRAKQRSPARRKQYFADTKNKPAPCASFFIDYRILYIENFIFTNACWRLNANNITSIFTNQCACDRGRNRHLTYFNVCFVFTNNLVTDFLSVFQIFQRDCRSENHTPFCIEFRRIDYLSRA